MCSDRREEGVDDMLELLVGGFADDGDDVEAGTEVERADVDVALGCRDEALALAGIDGIDGREDVLARAGLDLDEDQVAPVLGNDVNLLAPALPVALEDAVAFA